LITVVSARSKYVTAWFAIVAVAISVVAIVAVPIWLIQPFAPQTQRSLDISFLFRRWSPTFTLVAFAVLLLLAVYVWSNSRRWFAKAALILPLLIVLPLTWLARQNHFEWMFNPLANASYVDASAADFVTDKDMVLAVRINGDAVAYPVRQMAYHHVVQDVVGGMPITATY
jgi:hypothetical protein